MFLILTIFILGVSSLPYPPEIVIPALEVSPPAEINALTQNKFQSRSISPQTKTNNFEDTIKEVEAILKTNPALPRLTRGEILDLLDNITQTDNEKARFLNNTRDQKALMLVMPYTPSNDNNMQDLYTKPPVTHFIGGEPFTKSSPNQTNFKRKPSTVTSTSTTSTTERPTRRVPTKKQYTPKKQKPKQETNFRPSTTRTTEFYTSPSTRRKPESTTQSTTTYRLRSRGTPLRKRRPTTQSAVKYPNHRYPDEEKKIEPFLPSTGMTVIDSPKLSASSEDVSDLMIQEDTLKENVFNGESKLPHKFITQAPLTPKQPQEQVYFSTSSQQFVPESINALSYQTTTREPHQFEITTSSATIEDLNIPHHLSNVVKDMHLAAAMEGNINMPTIKPIPKFEVPDDTEKIKAMLESLGIHTPTTTTSMPDVKNLADTLSPDMKDLLMNFGLLPNPNPKPDVKVADPNPDTAVINADSFVGFKPLPEDSSSRSEMEELLASFGLGRNFRKEKSMTTSSKKTEKDDSLSFEAVPEEYRSLLTELGLKQGRKIRTDPVEKNLNKGATVAKQHIFNPTDSQLKNTTEEQLGKLGKLLDMIRELEKLNRTVTDEDLKKIDMETLKELVGSLNQNDLVPLNEKTKGPNPVEYDFGLSKNEVKRQENTTTTSTTTAAPEIVSISTTIIEETRNPSIKDLEDSFGGQTTTTTTTAAPETTTTTRTGFYYLVDWNSFLDIDDQKGKRVNLRFQPTIGDPKRFYSVSVP